MLLLVNLLQSLGTQAADCKYRISLNVSQSKWEGLVPVLQTKGNGAFSFTWKCYRRSCDHCVGVKTGLISGDPVSTECFSLSATSKVDTSQGTFYDAIIKFSEAGSHIGTTWHWNIRSWLPRTKPRILYSLTSMNENRASQTHIFQMCLLEVSIFVDILFIDLWILFSKTSPHLGNTS